MKSDKETHVELKLFFIYKNVHKENRKNAYFILINIFYCLTMLLYYSYLYDNKPNKEEKLFLMLLYSNASYIIREIQKRSWEFLGS